MSINDKKGINLTSGFKYVGRQPLDVRLVAEDESDLQSLVDNGATYNGMVVWVNSTSKRMVFNGSEFIEDVSPNTIGNINNVLEQINGGGTSSGGGSSSGGSSGGSSGSGITKKVITTRITALEQNESIDEVSLDETIDLSELETYDLVKLDFNANSIGQVTIIFNNKTYSLETFGGGILGGIFILEGSATYIQLALGLKVFLNQGFSFGGDIAIGTEMTITGIKY